MKPRVNLKINTQLEYIIEQNETYFSIPFPDPIFKNKQVEPGRIKFWTLDLGRRIEQDNINVAMEYSMLEKRDRMQKEAEGYLHDARNSFIVEVTIGNINAAIIAFPPPSPPNIPPFGSTMPAAHLPIRPPIPIPPPAAPAAAPRAPAAPKTPAGTKKLGINPRAAKRSLIPFFSS